ncbi:uncharacterized protein KD926_006162 [Aspergillus affinis]|uniref:uncharacterized protein n=1 Tax=Aspergillus affinis TaxID=1070780 RepID=UPI0022FE5204|nr:uncharacterized protein KD926_006162 [Aspergillus affinis]KAI9042038.1 hypothetical protein KD926_006162 [Aspergillus affinis]
MLPRTQRGDRETPESTNSATSLAKNERTGRVAWGSTTNIELKVINRCVCHKAEDGQEEINVEQTTSPTASIPTHAHAHGRSTALPPKGILKHPTKRFPFEDPVAVQRATGLRFEVGKLSSEFTLDDPDMVEVHAYKQNRGGKQPRDSMVVVDEARTRARKRFLSERGSREALLGEERI